MSRGGLTEEVHISIRPESDSRFPDLKALWAYRDLIILFARKAFKLTYKQTILGPMWIILSPLASSIIHMIVFGRIAGLGTDGAPGLLFYFCNNAMWTYFAACLTSNATTFRTNARLFGKVYFPRLACPVSQVLIHMLIFLIQFAFITALTLFYTASKAVRPVWMLWPAIIPVILLLGIMGMSFGIMISSLTVKYRDLAIVVNFGVSLWMYVTPVVYPYSELEEGMLKRAISFNPVTAPLELFRKAVLGEGTLMPGGLLYSLLFAGAALCLSLLLFTKSERTFVDVV